MKLTFSLLVIALTLGAVVLQTGCETQSAEANGLRVEPHAIGLRVNQTQEFTATGGFSYTWTLSDPSLGVLSRREGPTTIYTSRFNGGSNSTAVVQHLTVTSTVGTDRDVATGTNGDSTVVSSGFTDTAEAIIEHLPTPDAPPTITNNSLSVSPVSVVLTTNQTQVFTAFGEGPTYSWSKNTSFGSITPSGATATYNSVNTPTGSVVIVTVESNGDSANATVTIE